VVMGGVGGRGNCGGVGVRGCDGDDGIDGAGCGGCWGLYVSQGLLVVVNSTVSENEKLFSICHAIYEISVKLMSFLVGKNMVCEFDSRA